ncbi:MAG TPA: ABC transporter permease [bacterium]|nr:ABC transporter permease [bacterium]
MSNLFTICGKEFRQMFSGPLAYVVMTAFLMLTGFFFYDLFSNYSQILGYAGMYQNPAMMQQVNVNDMILTPLFHNINIILLMIIPFLTMRLYSEEKRQGTDELLLTSPLGMNQIVLGKLLAAVLFYALLLLLTLHFPAILFKYASPDLGKLAAGYLGLFLMGCSFLAFGLFTSTMTSSQPIAAASSFGMLLIFWILGWVSESTPGTIGDLLRYIAMTEHFEKFGEGVVRTGDLVYFVSFIALFTFLATRSVESTRWR